MIENPDGTRRVPTKEEILYGIRNGTRSISATPSSSQAANGANKSTYSEGRLASEPTQPRPLSISRRDAIDESYERSSDGANDGLSTEARPFREWHSSDDEHQQRTAAYSANYKPLKKSSIFKPYTDAIKDSFSKKQADSTKKRTASGKTLSKEEIDANRLKLIETILWLSEQSDEVVKATTRGHATVIIWSDLDRKDASIIADFLIERGKVSVQAAKAVRGLISLRTRIQLGLIIAPRAYRTMIVYLERGISIR